MMKGAVSWDDVRAELPQDIQEKLNERRDRRRIGAAMAQLRKEADVTQAEIAAGAEVPQGNISRTEKADDMLLSTIARYMQALGGEAELVLKSADGSETRLKIETNLISGDKKHA